jgi:hypothetical protein
VRKGRLKHIGSVPTTLSWKAIKNYGMKKFQKIQKIIKRSIKSTKRDFNEDNKLLRKS